MLTELAREGQNTATVMIDAAHLKAHRTASSLRGKKGGANALSDGCGGEDELIRGINSPRSEAG